MVHPSFELLEDRNRMLLTRSSHRIEISQALQVGPGISLTQLRFDL